MIAHAVDVQIWEKHNIASIMTMRSPTKSSNHSSACVVGPKTYSGKHVSSVRTLCAVREHVWVSRNRLLQSLIDPASTDPSRRILHGSMNTGMLTIAPPLGRLILESGAGAALHSHSLTTDEVNS